VCVAVRRLRPFPRLPAPTGPYAVGTVRRHRTDGTRPEPFVAETSARRTLPAQVWYPAVPPRVPDAARNSAKGRNTVGRAGTRRTDADPYLDSPDVADTLADVLGMPVPVLAGLAHGTTHARCDIAPERGRFPVLVHLNGFLAGKGLSRAWVEDLASHGYVVIGLDQPGTAACTVLPDGTRVRAIDKAELDPLMPRAVQADPEGHDSPALRREVMPDGIIPFLARDASAALDLAEQIDASDPLLAGHLDVERTGVFGISLGGYTASEAARHDRRLGACLVADAGQREPTASAGIRQPLMVMTRSADAMRRERGRIGGWPEAEIEHTLGTERALVENSAGPAWYVEMNDLHHMNWTDVPLWTPLARWTGMGGPVDPREAIAAVREGTRVFFDHVLRGAAADDIPAVAEHHAHTTVRAYRT
jgi:hypothetical protein